MGGAAATVPSLCEFGMKIRIELLLVVLVGGVVVAGPYTEVGINGYIGDDFKHANPLPIEYGGDADARVNPVFRGWASGYLNYLPADNVWIGGEWDNPTKALGLATGDYIDIVSLGDLDDNEFLSGKKPGEMTLSFGDPDVADDPNHICNVNGYDFVVFGNSFVSNFNTAYGSVSGNIFAELTYVEVSSNGIDFVRFSGVSLTAEPAGSYAYMTTDMTNIYNFAGKHPNGYGKCYGTGFDLSQLADEPNVVNGLVDINDICYVRIIDIPGSGDFYDSAINNVDPCSWSGWDFYQQNNPVYDAWLTWGSGGFDLEAVGVLKDQNCKGDINLDGIVDNEDLEIFAFSWLKHFGEDGWVGRCDLAWSGDLQIDFRDFAVFAQSWQQKEAWRDE